jgi:hypothetical protein
MRSQTEVAAMSGTSGWAKLSAIVVAGVYATSFFLPAMVTPSGPGLSQHASIPGWDAFAMGIVALFIPCPAWLANPGLIAGTVLLAKGNYGWASFLGVFSCVLALTTLFLCGPDIYPLVGFFVWLGSMVLLVGLSLVLMLGERARQTAASRSLEQNTLADESKHTSPASTMPETRTRPPDDERR